MAGGARDRVRRDRRGHADGRADQGRGGPARRRGLLRDLFGRRRRHRPRRAAGAPPRARRPGDGDRRAAADPVRRRRPRRRGPRRGLPREAAVGALGQRRLLLLRAGGARLPERRQRPGARAARAAWRRRRAPRLPPRGLLGLHGHLQGRGGPQRPLGRRRPAVDCMGMYPERARRRGEGPRWPGDEGASHRRRGLRRLVALQGAARRGRDGRRLRPRRGVIGLGPAGDRR